MMILRLGECWVDLSQTCKTQHRFFFKLYCPIRIFWTVFPDNRLRLVLWADGIVWRTVSHMYGENFIFYFPASDFYFIYSYFKIGTLDYVGLLANFQQMAILTPNSPKQETNLSSVVLLNLFIRENLRNWDNSMSHQGFSKHRDIGDKTGDSSGKLEFSVTISRAVDHHWPLPAAIIREGKKKNKQQSDQSRGTVTK